MITITMNMIRASIPCAAIKDMRHYLNGALLKWTLADRTLRMFSTDDHMASFFSAHIPTCNEHDITLIIPINVLKQAAKLKLPGDYNPDLLIRARDALRAFYNAGKWPAYALEQNGTSAAVMHNGGADAMVVFMPCRVTVGGRQTTYTPFI